MVGFYLNFFNLRKLLLSRLLWFYIFRIPWKRVPTFIPQSRLLPLPYPVHSPLPSSQYSVAIPPTQRRNFNSEKSFSVFCFFIQVKLNLDTKYSLLYLLNKITFYILNFKRRNLNYRTPNVLSALTEPVIVFQWI